MSDELLAIYLTDHLAAATAVSIRARRLAEAEQASDDADRLTQIVAEIEQDRETLEAIVVAARVSPRRYKVAAARLAERIGLLKTNGRLFRRSPLSSLIELELLQMAVTGKLALWESLQHSHLREDFDFGELRERAGRQLEVLAAAHARRAKVVGGHAVGR